MARKIIVSDRDERGRLGDTRRYPDAPARRPKENREERARAYVHTVRDAVRDVIAQIRLSEEKPNPPGPPGPKKSESP